MYMVMFHAVNLHSVTKAKSALSGRACRDYKTNPGH